MSNNRENGLGITEILLPAIVAAVMIIYAQDTFAQELETRTYTNTPIGVNFISVGYLHSQGNVLMDPALPIEGLDGSVDLGFLRYTRSLGLFGSSSKLKVLAPFTSGDWRGELEGVPQSRSATGAGDLRLTLEVNFLGAPALSTKEFSNFKPRTIVGGSIRIIAPTGEYDETELINLGSNRWAFRPEFGASHVFGHWDLTIAGAAWVYTDNDEFLGGSTLSQDPLYIIKGHAVYTVRPGFWVGLGLGHGRGGRTSVDGVDRDTQQRNWRFGIVLSYPIAKRHGLVFNIGSGINDGAGADFDSFGIAYQYGWGEI